VRRWVEQKETWAKSL